MHFAYTTNGAADGSINRYGNNEISVSGDVLTVQIGDSDNNRNISGVGIFQLKLSNKNLEDARQLAKLLCSQKDPHSDVTLPTLYGAKCDGEMRSSYINDFSRPVVNQIVQLVDSLTNAGVQNGRKLVKLDLSVVSIDREKDGFLVSARFSNSGEHPIKFKTPDRWNTRMGRDMDILGVNGYRVGSAGNDDDQLGLALAGKLLVDPEQFPDGEVNLAPHSSVVVKMKTDSISKFSAGAYDLNIGAFMNIKVIGFQSSLLQVDFHSDYKNPTRITFDRDYPSTPQEREQWEAMHKAEMSWQPVKPGQTFAEDGLYRAVRTGNGHRGLLLKPFKAGEVAPTGRVTMPMQELPDVNIDGPVQWVWEAIAPTPVKPWSFDMIADTVQFCEPGAECPRSGRWVRRIQSDDLYGRAPTRYDIASLVTRRRGERMPEGDEGTGRTDWEWVGA
ncbi:hypothetical protein AB4Y42_34875 [Paraburkholderia sp. EG286B]|uniref:hypothetical protein n=1 Tax=Paraburkholderia sp. EG286B TaxID=3237011 RepID=UPI0034D3413A